MKIGTIRPIGPITTDCSLLFLVDHPQRIEDEVSITQGLNLDWILFWGFLKLKSAGVDLDDVQETLLS